MTDANVTMSVLFMDIAEEAGRGDAVAIYTSRRAAIAAQASVKGRSYVRDLPVDPASVPQIHR